MARYDVYETGFDNLNETLVFGKRAIDGKSLYEICTLAVITSSDAVNKSGESKIKITTHYNKVNGSVYLAIDNCLRILKSIEEPGLIAMHEFDDNLECISVSTCGRFLLLCTQHGHIYVSDLNLIQDQTTENTETVCSELSFIFTEKVDHSAQGNIENFFLTTFADKTAEVLTFYAVTCAGLVKKITTRLDEHEEEQFVCELVYDANQTIRAAAFAYPYLCMEGTELGILDLRNMEYQSDDAFGIKTVYASGPNFVAFGNNGKIYLIDSARCLVFGVNNAFPERLDEFEYLWFIGNEDNRLMLAITKHQNIQAFRSIIDSDSLYDIHLEHPVHPNSYMKEYAEEIAFVSEVYKNDTLVELRLQIITTTDPKLRVQKLISQGQIDKAEMFAKQFNLDQDCIGEAKAFNIITKNECTSEDIDELLAILDTIKNAATKIQFCDSVVCKTAIDTRRVLSYAASTETTTSKNGANLHLWNTNCSVKLHRFDTYMSIYKEYDQRQWSNFVECDLIGELKTFLKQGCTDKAILLVLSTLYSEEFASTLTDDEVNEVISAVSEPSVETTMSFLNAFIPLVLKYKSDAMEILIKWVCNRIIQMEENVDFLECAITFLNDINNIIKHAPPRTHFDKAREKLRNSLKALENIETLNDDFNVHLPLKDCLQGPYAIVPTLLNVCIMGNFKPEKLRLLMKEILYPFLLECQEQPDEILCNQIKSFFQFEEIYWMDTALVLLEFISRVDYKLSLIQEILIKTAKPWSDKVKQIGFLVFDYPTVNPLSEEIAKLLKNEQFLILLEKYNINENNFVTLEDKEFYFRRIIYLNGDDYNTAFNDVRQLCDQNDQFETDYLMMTEFVHKGSCEAAFTLMDKMEPHYMCLLGKRLLIDICFKTRRFINHFKLRERLYNALAPLWSKLKRHCKRRQLDELLNSYNATRAMYWMHTNFKIELDLVLTPSAKKANIATFLVQVINSKVEIVSTLIDHCEKISSFFEETLDTVLLEYISICQNSRNTFVKIGEYILESSQCPQLLTQCAVNIIKCLQQESSSMDNKTFLDMAIAEDENSSKDLEDARLALQLCVRAALYNEEEDKITLSAIVEVIRLINCICCNLNSFIGELDDLQVSKKSPDLFPLTATIPMLFNTYEASKQNLPPNYCSFFIPDRLKNVDMRDELDTFIWNARILLNQKQEFNVINMIRLVQQTSIILPEDQKGVLEPLKKFLQESVLPQAIETLLEKNYGHKNIIFQLMLLYDNESFHEIILKYFRLYRKSPTKIRTMAQISLEVLNSKDIQFDKTLLVSVMNACKWWSRFSGLKMSFEAFITATPKERLEALMKAEIVTVEHLPEYCADFCIELESCYFKYLKTVLLNWRPNITYTTEINGKRSLKIQNSEEELLEKCDKVLACISNTKGVVNSTAKLWNSVNFYYYEVYLALLQINQKVASSSGSISELYQPLICFLKKYRRVNKPTSTEVEMWCGANPLKPLIDSLSEFRLPLTSTFLSSDIWNIIKPEVNLDTYKQWFKLSDYLSQYLKKHDICFYAITSPISSGIVDTTSSTWELSLKFDYLLPKIEDCANSMDNLEHATAAVYNLMCQMPNGADKVELAKLSYKFAKLYWESDINQSVKQTYVKVKQRFFNYSASHILHKYQLARVKYLGLVAKPSDLITELYNDRSIESFYNNAVNQCPGINSAVEELCILFQLDVLEECTRVLDEFLNCDFRLTLGCPRLQQENLIRATYLCKGKHFDHWQNYLMKKGLDNSEDNEILRANALRCFYYISSLKTIEETCHMTHNEFLNYLSKVSILAKLVNIGVQCKSVSELDKENKKRLLRNLSKLNTRLAVQCVANICKTYEFSNMKYWHYVVSMARRFQMYDDLRDYLEFLSNRHVSENIKNAWYVVLDHEFSNFKWDAISQAEIYLLIQNCPIFELDLEPYIEKCINRKRLDLASILKISK
ncbi:uncharacterized protein LOC109536795 isoform X3 [Dendroctonus ponderosae]|uniref:uncharacterized protein LOC109536795 isoform X3 n=1 Tax=Dendroctonus ponderosae TaxID=77166 RepID=UPI0020361FFF|nr:uncharacterized protein LOC109536795 isoform X3 [Dendroctonus ponderosae]